MATKKTKTPKKKATKKKTKAPNKKTKALKPAKKKAPKAEKAAKPKKASARANSRAGTVKKTANKKKKKMFKPGDYVVYPTHGVGKVVSIEIQEIAGHNLKLFVISFDRDRMMLRVPVSKVSTSGLRKLSSRKIMDGALNTLKGKARAKRTMWSRRAQEYETKINSGDPISIAEVVRDLHRNVGQPDQSFSERQIYESARDRMAYEVAAVERIDIEAATEKLEELLTSAPSRSVAPKSA